MIEILNDLQHVCHIRKICLAKDNHIIDIYNIWVKGWSDWQYEIPCQIPREMFLEIIKDKANIYITKSNSKRGSPWPNPLEGWKYSVIKPLKETTIEVVDMNLMMRSINIGVNLYLHNKHFKNYQLTQSYALDISNLRTTTSVCFKSSLSLDRIEWKTSSTVIALSTHPRFCMNTLD